MLNDKNSCDSRLKTPNTAGAAGFARGGTDRPKPRINAFIRLCAGQVKVVLRGDLVPVRRIGARCHWFATGGVQRR